jgi:hypothetical protein
VSWKDTERAIAARNEAGRRNPVSGRGGQADVEWPGVAFEVKHRRLLPRWLAKAISQAVQAAAADGSLPVVLLHEEGRRHDNDYVIIRLKDFESMLKGRGWPTA